MLQIISAARFAQLRSCVNKFCEDYFDDFTRNKAGYVKQHGYLNRIAATLIAGDYLQKIAREQKNTRLSGFYAAKKKEYENEQERILKRKKW